MIALSLPIVATALLIAAVYIFSTLSRDKSLAQFYRSQPTSGRRDEWFADIRANWRSVFKTPEQVASGYTKFAKAGIPFLVPNIRKGPILVIPPSELRNVLSKPQSIVDAHAPQLENVSGAYTMRDPGIYPTNYEVDLVKKQITKRFGSVAQEISEEVALAFDEIWGMSGEWTSVPAWNSLQDIAARAVNRAAVGVPLCRDKYFLKRVMKYSGSVIEAGPAISLLPSFLKPVLGPVIAWSGTRACEDSIKMLIPVVEARLQMFHARSVDSDDKIGPPNDILQWLIEESAQNSNPEQMTARRLAHRIVMLNFNSAPPIGMTLANTLCDLYGLPESANYIKALRRECDAVFGGVEENYWSKDAVARLHLVDSTIRESMRHSDFGWLAFPRRVKAPDGMKISNIHVPRGVQLEIPMHSIHMDPSFYQDPTTFNPFRFAGNMNADGSTEKTSSPPKPVVTLDDTFMAFGYGRNGCPGRFVGAHIVKVMMAYILQHYDIDVPSENGKRPSMMELMEFRLPSYTNIKIRRRE